MEFFASSGVDRVFLFGGDQYWIDIKHELTAGEERRLYHSAIYRATRPMNPDGTLGAPNMEVDLETAAFTKVALYLVDWNVPGPDGKTVPIANTREKTDALRNLTPAAFSEVERVIDAEVEARAKGKTIAPGPTGSSAPKAS